MVILGGWVFLMSELPLYPHVNWVCGTNRGSPPSDGLKRLLRPKRLI